MGESICNKNYGQENFRGENKRFEKSKEHCFKRFAREYNVKNKETQGDEAKVASQEFDEGNTLLVMIMEGECNSNNNNFGNATKLSYNRLHDIVDDYMQKKNS